MITANQIIVLFETKYILTVDDLYDLEKDFDREVARTARILLDFDDDKIVSDFLVMANKAIKIAVKPFRSLYVNEKELKRRLFESEFPSKVSGFFPLPVYVSSSRSDKMTIGILVHFNGKLEMFEGNDEASPETIQLVNDVLGVRGITKVVYGMHTDDVVYTIKRTNKIPKGLYVSPDRKYAEGHWRIGQQRVLFSCEIDLSVINQESEYDWKVLKNTKVKKIKIL